MRKFWYVLGLLALAGVLLLVPSFRSALISAVASVQFRAEIRAVVACTEEKNATVCARPIIQKMLGARSGTDIMNTLSGVLDAQQCHYIGHVVGQQSQIRIQDIEASIMQCDRSCDSACLHGIIGEAFAEELGMGSPDEADIDLSHLSPDDAKKIGIRLCTSPETCHGVGHALYQAFESFEPALEVCRNIGERQTVFYCQQAVFMEYADILYSRNMRAVNDTEMPTLQELRTLCPSQSGPIERRSCFRYFPRMYISTLTKAGSSTREAMIGLRQMCRTYAAIDDRINCTIGIGVYNSYYVVEDVPRAVNECLALPEIGDQAACNFGLVSVATQDRQQATIAFCRAIPDEGLRGDCYHAVFYFLNRLGTPVPEALSLCERDAQCLSRAEDFLKEPSIRIRQRYKI